jgi:hypothetical protein
MAYGDARGGIKPAGTAFMSAFTRMADLNQTSRVRKVPISEVTALRSVTVELARQRANLGQPEVRAAAFRAARWLHDKRMVRARLNV